MTAAQQQATRPSGVWWRRERFWNISARTAHIIVTGALFGGHVFDVAPERLLVWLYLAIATGAVLVVLESSWRIGWLHEACGLLVLAKLALLASIAWLWPYRVGILVLVFTLASVGAHMPRKLRHYSLLLGHAVDR